jgi:integrase
MASGCIVVYPGKRGDVFRMKFTDADGKQRMETLGPAKIGGRTVLTQRRAEKALQARLADIETARWRPPSPVKFAGFAESWLADNETRRQWKPPTVYAYGHVVKRLVDHFGSWRLSEIEPADIDEYITKKTAKGYSPSTVNRDVTVLGDILKSAVKKKLIVSNPAADADRPKYRQKKWRILKPVEVALVSRSFTDEQARVVFLVLVICGLRRFELQGLRWRDVDLVENVLRVVVSKSEDGERSIAIPPMLAEELWQHRRRTHYQGADELVFCNPTSGEKYTAERFAPLFRAALKTAGITDYFRPFHDLRHTALTNDAAAGSTPVVLMTKAGHASMTTTKKYIHLAGTVFRDEAERLEQRYGFAVSTESSTERDDAAVSPVRETASQGA